MIRPEENNPARLLIKELLDTRQFPEAIKDFIAPYINDSQQKLILAVKAGDIAKANYECGTLDTLTTLLSRMDSFSKKAISTN